MHTAVVIVLALFSVLGTCGHVSVLLCIAFSKPLRTYSNILIVNFAFADLIVTALVMPVTLVLSTMHPQAIHPHFCSAVAFLVCFSCGSSTQFTMLTALSRFMQVFQKYKKCCELFQSQCTFLLCLIVWVYCASFSAQGWVGWTRYTYDPAAQACITDAASSTSYNIVCLVVAIVMPVVTMVVCYSQIIYKINHSRLRIIRQQEARNMSALLRKSTQRRANRDLIAEIKLILMLGSTIVVFALLWIPAVVTVFWNEATPAFRQLALYCILINSCVNPVLYGILDGNIRKCYLRLCTRLCTRLCPDFCYRLLHRDNLRTSGVGGVGGGAAGGGSHVEPSTVAYTSQYNPPTSSFITNDTTPASPLYVGPGRAVAKCKDTTCILTMDRSSRDVSDVIKADLGDTQQKLLPDVST